MRRPRPAVRHDDQPLAHGANTGRINASNPCSEYLHLDNSACNLASINLLKFLDDDRFDVDAFRHTVEIVFTAQEILVGRADYPTEKIAENAHDFRQLGLGYANLGALLMALGLPYDSADGRAWAAAITSLMTGHAYATRARTAAGWARSPGSPTTRSTCCASCGCTAMPAERIDGVDAVPAVRRPRRPAGVGDRRPRRRGARRAQLAGHGLGADRHDLASCSTVTRPASSPTSASSRRRSSSAAGRCRSSTRRSPGRSATSATTTRRSTTSSPTSTPRSRSSARRTSPPTISRCSPARWATTRSTTRATCG